jgi:hypothetical protein
MEAVGAVVGMLPLLLDLLNQYAESYSGSRREKIQLRKLRVDLSTIQVILLNTLKNCLAEFLDEEHLSAMIRNPDDDLWSDPTVQSGIVSLLGPSADHFNALAVNLRKQLSKVLDANIHTSNLHTKILTMRRGAGKIAYAASGSSSVLVLNS